MLHVPVYKALEINRIYIYIDNRISYSFNKFNLNNIRKLCTESLKMYLNFVNLIFDISFDKNL